MTLSEASCASNLTLLSHIQQDLVAEGYTSPDQTFQLATEISDHQKRSCDQKDSSKNTLDVFDLHSPDILKSILAIYGEKTYPKDDVKAITSMWSQWYFGLLTGPLSVLACHGGACLSLDRNMLMLELDEKNCPRRFILQDHYVDTLDPHGPLPEIWPHLKGVITHHFEPLIATLCQISKLSPKVFWSNIGVIFDYVFLTGFRNCALDTDMFLQSSLRPDGERNPLSQPYKLVQDENISLRKRRICCLRYMLTDVAICPTCPHKDKRKAAK